MYKVNKDINGRSDNILSAKVKILTSFMLFNITEQTL